MVTTHTPAPATTSDEQIRIAACHMYDADLHIAHQSHVDAWFVAASAKLHAAIVEHLAATVGRLTSSWSHLIADDQDGRGRAAAQPRTGTTTSPPGSVPRPSGSGPSRSPDG